MSQQKIATRIVEKKLLVKKLIKLAHGTPETMAQEGRAPDGLPNPWVEAGLISPYSTNFRSAQDPLPAMTPQEYADSRLPDRNVPSIGAFPADKPFPGLKPAQPAQKYRGEGGYWDFGYHPQVATFQKTFPQLDAEQGTKAKYLASSSVIPAANAFGQGVLGGGMQNMFYNLAGFPAVATDSLGWTTGATQRAREDSIISADRFWRGLHQTLNPTKSRAYDDQFGTNGAVAQILMEQANADGPNTPAAETYESYNARQGFADNFAGPAGGFAAAALPATVTAAPAAVGTVLSALPFAAATVSDLNTRRDNSNIGMTLQEQTAAANELAAIPGMSDSDLQSLAQSGLTVNIRGQAVPFSSLAPDTAQSLAASAGLNPLFEQGWLPRPANMLPPAERIQQHEMPVDSTLVAAPPAESDSAPVMPDALMALVSDPDRFNARLSELSPEQLSRYNELSTQIEQAPESPQNAAAVKELSDILIPQNQPNSAAPSATQQPPQPVSAPAPRRPFADDPSAPAVASAPPVINEPDLSDPFGDKEQPAPQLPPGAEFLPPGTAPEDVEATTAAFEAVPKTPETQAAVGDINSPEAQKKIKEGQNTYVETGAAEYAKTTPPPTNSPGDWAGWLNDMMDHVNTSWNNMSPEAQLAFGLGVPMAVIGLLSGNVGGFLLGAVGLGTAGISAAGSGMFGDTAQTAAESVTGAKPAEPIKPLSDDDQLSVVRGLSSATNPMEYFSANKQQIMQIADLPDDRLIAIAQQLDPQTRNDVIKMLTGFSAKIDEGLKKLTDSGFTPGPAADAAIRLRAAFPGGESLPPGIKSGELPELKAKVERMLQILNSNQATPANNTGAYIQNDLIPKIARCWKGYEPVPGKKPYSEDSCRPQGSKKKKKMKKKAEDYLSFLSSDKPAILTLIRGYYDKQTGPQSKKVRA